MYFYTNRLVAADSSVPATLHVYGPLLFKSYLRRKTVTNATCTRFTSAPTAA
jgi:hypothetical protein